MLSYCHLLGVASLNAGTEHLTNEFVESPLRMRLLDVYFGYIQSLLTTLEIKLGRVATQYHGTFMPHVRYHKTKSI